MANEWYFGWDDRRFGPFSEEQLMQLAERGRIQPMDIIWKEGIEKGILAEKVRNLFRSPRVEPDPVVTNQPVPSPSVGNARSEPGTSVKYNEWLASNNDVKAEGILQEVPDGLIIKALAGHDDSPSPLVPVVDPSSLLDTVDDHKPAATPKQRRAVALKGAVILNQDGAIVQYQKKCTRCGFEEPRRTTRPIRSGIHRDPFFCPKCRRAGEVEIQGIC